MKCILKFYKLLIVCFLLILILIAGSYKEQKLFSLKKECAENLFILCEDLINLQNSNQEETSFGALYCEACSNYHTRASESILPFAAAYSESNNDKYLKSAILTGNWLIKQQQQDGSWFETPDKWTGTTTDQLLSLSAAYPIIKRKIHKDENEKWILSIKKGADWLVKKMNPDFASINYCATTTASLRLAFKIIPDSAYAKKAKELAMLVIPKFDEDYFLTGEGNRIRGTKYGIDLGYNMDMSLWGLGLYAKLADDELVDSYVRESLKRCIYFVYPDGSIDNSWGVRSSKWTTYGSFTADGCQILFGLYSENNPVYRKAAIENLKYFMKMRNKGLITYGPHYKDMFNEPPCIYPTFCRAKNLALTILFGDQTEGKIENLPSQKSGWARYFKTINTALVRTKKIMATITGYQYKDIRRGADFKYMFRPSGGSISNLWVDGYGHLQASSQTEYHKWEMNYPEIDSAVSITPRIEFTDSIAYYTNLFEFDANLDLTEQNGIYIVESIGELKDRNRWEGGVAYTLTHKIADDYIEKEIKLRYHGNKPYIKIIEPIIQNETASFNKIDEQKVEINDSRNKFIFELLDSEHTIGQEAKKEKFKQPFPSFKVHPLVIRIKPENSFLRNIHYRIKLSQ